MKRDARPLFVAILVAGLLTALTGCAPVRSKPEAARHHPASPFRAIDAYALAAPTSVTDSVRDLAAYLTATSKTDQEKARAIFRWVAANISYDVEGYGSSHYGDLSPDAVLRRREAVCQGYASLFDSLAKAAGLEAVTINGYAKGMGYRAGERFTGPTDHAWNAVKIDGRWQLIDCTWAAGIFYEGTGYRKEFDPYFFCTPPEEFLYTHFPKEARWQLVERPVSLEQFERRPYFKAPFFEKRLKPMDNNGCVIQTEASPVLLRFGSPPGVDVRGRLYKGGKDMGASNVQVKSKNGLQSVRVMLPSPGTYELRLFVSDQRSVPGRLRFFDWAAEYKIVLVPGSGGR